MQKIAIYGKGGIGKSTIASNLSAVYAKQGLKVLHVGCDPKHDSTIRILNGKKIDTVIDLAQQKDRPTKDQVVTKGVYGIDCVECGGPKAGVGCAGRGITRMFEILEDQNILDPKKYDLVIFDVLGDVVCGGFAAPLKRGFGEKIFIVVSEEIMSLYAANKIAQAVNMYEDNGVYLGGIIVNQRDNAVKSGHVEKFVKSLNSEILAKIPRSKEIADAEHSKKTVVQGYPKAKVTKEIVELSQRMLKKKKNGKRPKFLNDMEFNKIFVPNK